MKSLVLIVAVLIVVALVICPAFANGGSTSTSTTTTTTTTTPPTGQGPSVSVGESIAMTAVVVGIDRSDREVTLRGPQGNVVTVDVPDSVKNFDQLEVGDTVNVNYYESIAVFLGPKGQKPSATSTTVVGRGPSSGEPEGFTVQTIDAVAVIKAIDKTHRTVTLQGPTGDLFTVTVPQSVQTFDKLKVGDSISVRYTESTALSVQKP